MRLCENHENLTAAIINLARICMQIILVDCIIFVKYKMFHTVVNVNTGFLLVHSFAK